ncbi:hypothetical protein B0H17DRAFT_1067165 [Mycena rosella]|uniref:Roadblock/LAMTOR2 domain-containing protein n=1 Tax=Mycena rosella TaxID=1033263 RepID=A0AAD7DDM5_MYCRO|nr:hypothetical protein B0H17DRAFT_1067165 [Mycena rosella]
MDSPKAPTRSPSTPQPNPNGTAAAAALAPGMSPELEQTLALLSAHRAVLGYILIGRGHPVSIVRHAGVVFEGEQGRKYAGAIGRIVESVQAGLEEVHAGEGDADELRFLRIRTKRHEIMISPGARPLVSVPVPVRVLTMRTRR